MEAIKTKYNGIEYRSKAEARWAVWFDFLGIKFEYEPEGFKLKDGTWYLPDFRVKCYGCRSYQHMVGHIPGLHDNGQKDSNGEEYIYLYIEVKNGVWTKNDENKIRQFTEPIIVFNSMFPEIEDYYDEWEDNDWFYSFEHIDWDIYAACPCVHDRKFFLMGCDADNELSDMRLATEAFKFAISYKFDKQNK